MSNRKVVIYFLILVVAIAGFWIGVVLRLIKMGNPRPSAGGMLLAQFDDVGAGDAAFFESPAGLSVLVDTGPDDSGGSEVVSQMRRLQVSSPAVIVLTSTLPRSIGGLSYILSHTDFHGPVVLPCEPAQFSRIGGATARDAVSAAGRAHVPLVSESAFESAPQHALMGGSDAAMTLIPIQEQTRRFSRYRRRIVSETIALAVRVDFGQRSIFDAGGLTSEQEDQLIALRVRMPCDVLVTSDCGSVSSTSSEFLALTGPRIAVITTSTNPGPDPSMLSRLYAADATTDRTDTIGSLTLAVGGDPTSTITLYGPQAALPVITGSRPASATH